MFMLRKFAKICLVLMVAGSLSPSVRAFSLLGPIPPAALPDGYQTAILGYQATGDIGTPKNLGEGYRWNTRKLYYAFDANFLNYFGSNGVAAIDQAFAMLNSLSNVSSYSSDLSEWPLNTSRANFRAETLGLLDLRSTMLSLLAEQLGLAQPDRWTWALRLRLVGPAPGCPIEMIYEVIKRNFDPVTFEPSSYVNGTLYSYTILDNCAPGQGGITADAVEVQVDPNATAFSAVANDLPLIGQFFTGLTRDDVGGLRYLWATNRLYTEGVAPTSLLVDSNSTFNLIGTTNLSGLPFGLTTTTAAQLLALFPGLQITSTTNPPPFFTNVVTTNFVATPTNCLGCPAGSPPILVLVPVLTTNILPIFKYTYGNVLIVSSNNQSTVVITTTNVVNSLQPGVLITNVSTQTYPTNIPGGEFLIIPPNQCGFSILATQLTSVVLITNAISTNVAGFTNVGQGISIATVFTNHTLVISIPNCTTNSVALREGVESLRFFRQDFDNVTGTTWTPITNTYTLVSVSNNVQTTQTFFRVVTQPDFLISAVDVNPPGTFYVTRSISFNTNNVGAGLAGPGIIQPPVQFQFTKVGPIYVNPAQVGFPLFTFFIPPLFPFPYGEFSQELLFNWGSFDGSTNEPVVYPSGTSVINLENNVFLQITVSGPLPVGHSGVPYNFTIPVSGQQPPFTWTLAAFFPGQPPPALPPGLNLDSATGVISGTPTTVGVYDFVVQVTDSIGRISRRTLEIEIDP
jgi:hypothetical protein